MAEGGEVSGRLEKCQPCARKGRNNDVVMFCGQCRVSFCSSCLVQHDELFDHPQIQGADDNAGSGTVVTEETTELCKDHKKPITLYCNVDSKFGCVTCMDANHKHCKQVIYLPVSATALLQDIGVTKLNELLDKTIQDLQTIKSKHQPQLSSLSEDREKCLEKVNTYHTRLLGELNTIFRSTTDAIDQQFEAMRAEMGRNMEHVEKSLADLECSRSRLQQFQNNHVQGFREMKTCQEFIKMAEAVCKEATHNLKTEGMDAVIDERLNDLLADLKTLVTVIRRRPIEVKKKYQIDVSEKEDIETCQITASCVLPDSSILLVDCNNRKLKRLNGETLAITDTFSMGYKPIGVCCIDGESVAMTTDIQTLYFLAISPKLTDIRTLTFKHHCGYVARCKKELFITDENKALYVYSMNGSLLRKCTTDTLGKDLFSYARHVVANDTGDKLFVTDWENGLLTLNRHWMTVSRVGNLKSSGTRGVCLDDVGGAFVCGYTTNKVAYVSPEEKHAVDVLTESDGLLRPKSVCFEGTHRRLFISQEDSNYMMVSEMI